MTKRPGNRPTRKTTNGETHHVEGCSVTMAKGCDANPKDIAQLIGRMYPFMGETVQVRDKAFLVSGKRGAFTMKEIKEC